MLRREFLQMLGLRPALAAVNPNPQPESSFVSAQQFGATGDGQRDDTAALQSAIDFALSAGKPCFVPSGVYRISAPLQVGQSSGPKQQGFRLFGAGRTVDQAAGSGGTLIVLSGRGHEAILKLENSVWRGTSIADLGLQCQQPAGATYGILFRGTQFSGHTVRNVSVSNAGIGYAIVETVGGNGENTLYDNCVARNVDKFFYSNSGQAYVQHFNHCVCILNSGGTYFHLDLKSGGGGIEVFDFNGTGSLRPGGRPSDTTLFRNGQSNSCLNFIGGRVEHLTQLYESRGGSPNLFVTAKFEGMQFSVDSQPGELGKRFIEISVTPDILTVSSCNFYGIRNAESLEILVRESYAYVIFQACMFWDLAKPPTIVADYPDVFNQVRFEDCKMSAVTSGGRRLVPFERNHHHDIGALGRRKAFSENGWVHSGRPANFLIKSNFTDRTGRNVQADAPWQHFGQSQTMDTSDWSDVAASNRSSSPWAKTIQLPPKSGLLQVISALDLSSVPAPYNMRGLDLHFIGYQCMLTSSAVHSGVRFALTEAGGSRVYDEIVIGRSDVPRMVTLSAYSVRTRLPTFVQLVIENLSSMPATLEFGWQLASNNSNPAFVGTSGAASVYGANWGMNAESGRFWHRLALPYKADTFGSAGARPLEDLQSDIYLSRSTERVNTFVNGQWWAAPRTSSASAEPQSGAWAQGDMVFNSDAVAGGPLGWIQVTPGQLFSGIAWRAGAAYRAGDRVYHQRHVFDCVRSGTSSSGQGPSTVDGVIEDGGCAWRHAGFLAAAACKRDWAAGIYTQGARVHHDGRVYECQKAGRSTSAPAGEGAGVVDGDVVWQFVGPLALFKTIGVVSS